MIVIWTHVFVKYIDIMNSVMKLKYKVRKIVITNKIILPLEIISIFKLF